MESSGTFTRTDAGGYIPGPGLETEALHKASMGMCSCCVKFMLGSSS